MTFLLSGSPNRPIAAPVRMQLAVAKFAAMRTTPAAVAVQEVPAAVLGGARPTNGEPSPVQALIVPYDALAPQ